MGRWALFMDIYNRIIHKKRILNAFVLAKSAPFKGVENIQFAMAPSLTRYVCYLTEYQKILGTSLVASYQSPAECSLSLTIQFNEMFLVSCV